MSKNIFVISDTHFYHENILKFADKDGKKVRPGFDSVEHMNETIIENWNKTVKPDDVIYHLGDFTFGSKSNIKKVCDRLNGRKKLILGNHDYDAKDYIGLFENVMSFRQFGRDTFKKKVVLCHFPLHLSAFEYRIGGDGLNIHGHLHEKLTGEPYHVNVCVEHTNFTPVSLEELIDKN